MSEQHEHALTRLMESVTQQNFQKIGLGEPALPHYAARVLLDFIHVDNLYKIKNARGRPLQDVGEMLLEGDVRHRATSFERERFVRKHIGDFTLFFTGMFPEHIKARRNWWRLDRYLDWIETGKESYRIVGKFDMDPYAQEAPLFRRMADHFDFMVVALNMVRDDLTRMGEGGLQRARNLLD